MKGPFAVFMWPPERCKNTPGVLLFQRGVDTLQELAQVLHLLIRLGSSKGPANVLMVLSSRHATTARNRPVATGRLHFQHALGAQRTLEGPEISRSVEL